MLLHRRAERRRGGAVIVEMAFVLPFLFLIVLGIWEVGRIVQIKQKMNNAARSGARLAAQGKIVSDLGSYTEITTANVETAVRNYLTSVGITDLTDLTVTFEFLDGTSTRQPWQGLKNERFRVRVTLPYRNVRWTNLNISATDDTLMIGECVWVNMNDDPFSVSSTLPGWNP